jgi:hypothetical protein
MPWTDYLAYTFPEATLFALFFLLGSQAVAGLSDLRRMSAQREFMEIWILFVFVVLAIDIWRIWHHGADWLLHLVKWGLVATVGILSWHPVGVLFKLARGDVWAIVAVACLFNPLFILIYVVALKLSDLILRPALRAFGAGSAYPFIPVVTVATLITVGLIFFDIVGWALSAFGLA